MTTHVLNYLQSPHLHPLYPYITFSPEEALASKKTPLFYGMKSTEPRSNQTYKQTQLPAFTTFLFYAKNLKYSVDKNKTLY